MIYFLSLVLFCIPWVLPNGNFQIAIELFLIVMTGILILKKGLQRRYLPLILFFLAYIPFIAYPADVVIIQLRSLVFPLILVGVISNFRIRLYSLFLKFFKWLYLSVVWIAIYEWVTGSYVLTATNRFGEELVRLETMHRSSSLIGNAIDLSHFLVLGGIFLLPKVKWRSLFVLLVALALTTTKSRGPMISVLLGIIMSGQLCLILKTKPKQAILFGILLLAMSSLYVERLALLNRSDLIHDPYRFSWLIASIRIIGDNILLGSGPGTFGGWVSINYFESSLYSTYGVDTYGISSIDMFWPHLIAELGLLGTLAYLYIFRKAADTIEKRIALIYCLIASLFSIALESQVVLFLLALILYERKKDITDFIHDGSFQR